MGADDPEEPPQAQRHEGHAGQDVARVAAVRGLRDGGGVEQGPLWWAHGLRAVLEDVLERGRARRRRLERCLDGVGRWLKLRRLVCCCCCEHRFHPCFFKVGLGRCRRRELPAWIG